MNPAGGRLSGKVVLVTGAASGIGRATARRCAEEGARVVLADRNTTEGEAAAVECGVAARFVAVDLTDATAVAAAVAQCGTLDGVFNGAGASGRAWGDGPVADCSEEGWDRTVAVNLKSAFLARKYAIPLMLRGGGGAVVNLASVLGLVGGDEDFATHAYAASKGGLIALSRAMAAYYAPQRLRVNVICPGLIRTPMSRRAQADATLRARLPRLQPLTGDFGEPADVAHAAVYLLSDEARFVTGAVLTVDGGWTTR